MAHTSTQDTVKQREKRFRALIKHSWEVILLSDAHGNYSYASPSIERVLGYTPEEFVQFNGFTLIHPEDIPAIAQAFQTLLATPGLSDTQQFRGLHKNGSWRWVEATATNLLDEPSVGAIVTNFHDITEHKQAEERLHLLNEASNLLASSLDHQITLKEIAQLIVPSLADYCRIAVLDEHRHIKDIAVNHIHPEQLALVQALYEQYKDRATPTYGLPKLLQTGQPELISSVAENILETLQDTPELLTIIQTLGLKSYMGVPLIARERTIGAITFSSIQPYRRYTADDLVFAQELAGRIALALDNARLYQEAQAEIAERKQIEQNLLFLSEASKVLASSLDYQTTLTNVARLAVPHIADWCAIDMLTADGSIKQLVVHHKDPTKVQWARGLETINPRHKDDPIGVPKVLRAGRSEFYPVISDELLAARARNAQELEIMRISNPRSVMIVPLTTQGQSIGAITFVSSSLTKQYTEADLAMAEELASRASLAIANAHLYTEAQNAIGIRDDFISIASHELKTPLTSLKMYTQVLHKQLARKGEKSLTAYLAKMDAQLNKLTALIGDLLNVSKIELGQLPFQDEMFDVNEVVKETVEQMQLTTTKHTIRIEGMIPQPVWGDKDRIGQVLTNLLSNALKYSPEADTVLVRLTPEQDVAVVTVQDFGIGIAKEHQSKIFTRFYRVNDPKEKTYPGLGIGLYIANEIIKRHGGTMTVISEKGKGSQFSFTLPYTRSTLKTS